MWENEQLDKKRHRPQKNAGRADSHAKSPVEFLEPLRFEEALGSSFTTGDPEPERPTTNFDCPANLEQSAARTVAADGGGRVVDGYSEAIAAEPSDSSAHFDHAVSLAKLEQWEAAVGSFRRALEIKPG